MASVSPVNSLRFCVFLMLFSLIAYVFTLQFTGLFIFLRTGFKLFHSEGTALSVSSWLGSNVYFIPLSLGPSYLQPLFY